MILTTCSSNTSESQVADVCRGMMADITALRARVCQLEEEKRSLDQHLNLKHRERYDTLVRQLFSTCVLLKVCTFSVLTCRLKFNFDIIKSWTTVYVGWCQLAQLSVPPTVTSGQIPYEYGPRCATAGEQREEGRRGPNHQTENKLSSTNDNETLLHTLHEVEPLEGALL